MRSPNKWPENPTIATTMVVLARLAWSRMFHHSDVTPMAREAQLRALGARQLTGQGVSPDRTLGIK
ncbi:MAG: hypothetical protein WAS36_00495 [Candidatus Saccharimonadales bacterium]